MKLDFGCAFDQHDGWTGVDRDNHGFNVVADVLNGLPFDDGYFDVIVSNHSLQCVRFDDLPRALGELRRVLKVGGVLRILVPDFEWALDQRDGGFDFSFPISKELEPDVDSRFLRYLFWHGDARSAFTLPSLAATLNRNGFQNVRACGFKQTYSDYPEIVELDSRAQESIIVECAK